MIPLSYIRVNRRGKAIAMGWGGVWDQIAKFFYFLFFIRTKSQSLTNSLSLSLIRIPTSIFMPTSTYSWCTFHIHSFSLPNPEFFFVVDKSQSRVWPFSIYSFKIEMTLDSPSCQYGKHYAHTCFIIIQEMCMFLKKNERKHYHKYVNGPGQTYPNIWLTGMLVRDI